jgi:hypothetical protein
MIRAEFTLTMDDFSEWQKASPVTRRFQAPAIVALCGFFLVVIGYILPRFFSECIAPLGIACLFAGLLATVLSIPLWYLLQPRPGKIKSEMRSTYNRFYKERRVFEASDSGWTYSAGTRQDSRQWSDLFHYVQIGQTLVLMDPFRSYPLPVSALTVNELKALELLGKKQLAGEKLFSVSMAATAADFMIAFAKHNWVKRTAKTALSYCCGLAFLAILGLALADSSPSMELSPWFYLIVLLLPLLEGAHYHSLYLTYWKRSFQDADVLKEAICFNQGSLHHVGEIRKLRYEWFESVVETSRVLMLYFAKNSFFLIPKSGLSSEQLTQLRQLLALPDASSDVHYGQH